MASIAELVHGKETAYSITHPAYLMPEELKRLHFNKHRLQVMHCCRYLQLGNDKHKVMAAC